jgi:hypothetical protein
MGPHEALCALCLQPSTRDRRETKTLRGHEEERGKQREHGRGAGRNGGRERETESRIEHLQRQQVERGTGSMQWLVSGREEETGEE